MIYFPLKKRRLIRGCAAHKAAGLSCGADYEAKYEPVYSPEKGKVLKRYYGNEGGNWLWIEGVSGRVWEFAHLSSYKVKQGDTVKAAQEIAISGNTGKITTGPHLHLQIIKPGYGGNPSSPRLDPEIELKGATLPGTTPPMSYDNKLIRLGTSLNYALVIRGKKYVFPQEEKILAMILVLEKTGVIQIPKVSTDVWGSLPMSEGLKF